MNSPNRISVLEIPSFLSSKQKIIREFKKLVQFNVATNRDILVVHESEPPTIFYALLISSYNVYSKVSIITLDIAYENVTMMRNKESIK